MRAALGVWLAALAAAARAPEAARPRGVSLARAPLYAPADTFTCLDGSLAVPYAFVNDDYCDCPDGTDEPGTAACPGVFHCANAGHVPLDLPSSRVNDGVCDCCDGADEYATGACTDTCAELGREARLRAQARAHVRAAGGRLRHELAGAGARLRAERERRLSELDASRAEADQLKAERERLKSEAERLESAALEIYRAAEEAQRQAEEPEEEEAERTEAEETFRKFDSDGDGFLRVDELRTRSAFDKNRDGEVSEEEARFFLGENSEVSLNDFAELAWPLIKPYLMIEGGLFKPPASRVDDAEDRPDDERADVEPETEDVPDDEEEEERSDGEEDEGQKDEERPAEPAPKYDEETRRLVESADEARNEFVRAERAVRDIDVEIEKIKGMLDKDYGPNEEFATLADQCLEFTDREYLYKLCPFDKASQQPKSGGGETSLGTWGEWVGAGDDKYSAMLYSHGVSCWNGPDRSARINVHCGLESKILSVVEPNRCEYAFEIETPAACFEAEPERSQDRSNSHDEL